MGGVSTKEEVIVQQESSTAHMALSASSLGIVLLAIVIFSCYYLFKKLRNNIVHHVQRNGNLQSISTNI